MDEIVAMSFEDSTLYFLHNSQFSVVTATKTNGAICEMYQYEPYGKLSRADAFNNPITSSAYGNPFGFTGQYNIDGRNRDFRSRLYSSGIGRFLSKDPAGYVDAINQYTAYFVPNHTDPLGLIIFDRQWFYDRITAVDPGVSSGLPSRLLRNWIWGGRDPYVLSHAEMLELSPIVDITRSGSFNSAISSRCATAQFPISFPWSGSVWSGARQHGTLGNFTSTIRITINCDCRNWSVNGNITFADRYNFNIVWQNLLNDQDKQWLIQHNIVPPDFFTRPQGAEIQVILMNLVPWGRDFNISSQSASFSQSKGRMGVVQ